MGSASAGGAAAGVAGSVAGAVFCRIAGIGFTVGDTTEAVT